MNADRMREIMIAHIYKAMDKVALLMEAKAIELAPKAIGQLASRINSRTEINDSKITAIAECTALYGKYIETGTGPAVGHSKYLPPEGALQTWVLRILGGDETVEKAIRWHIYHYGTKPQPFMKPAKEYASGIALDILKNALHEAVMEMKSELR